MCLLVGLQHNTVCPRRKILLNLTGKAAQIHFNTHIILRHYVKTLKRHSCLSTVTCRLCTNLSPHADTPSSVPRHISLIMHICRAFNGDTVTFPLSSVKKKIKLRPQCQDALYLAVINPQIHKHAKRFTGSPIALLEI